MDFKAFQPPPSDHHALNAGLSTENGVSAKGLVEGVNKYLGHLFKVIGQRAGDVVDAVDGEARERIMALEEAVAALQIRIDRYEQREGKVDAPVLIDPRTQDAAPIADVVAEQNAAAVKAAETAPAPQVPQPTGPGDAQPPAESPEKAAAKEESPQPSQETLDRAAAAAANNVRTVA